MKKILGGFAKISPRFVKFLKGLIRARQSRREWKIRTAAVVGCPENDRLPRVPDAGRIFDGWQVTHNGLLVKVDGYYGSGITEMLSANRGSHEPQEEVVFMEVLKVLPRGATMVEAGAYWAFYSMWFLSSTPEGRAFLIEPSRDHLEVGRVNFEKNGFSGTFEQAFVGGAQIDGTPPTVSIESFAKNHNIRRIDLLHLDIQGHELDAIGGCAPLLETRSIGYIFVSTHGKDLHEGCLRALGQHGYKILAKVNMEETCSVDGLIVACSPDMNPPATDIA